MDVAQSIGAGLAKATIAGSVDGVLVDASDVIDHDASLRIITAKDEEGVEIIRHSCAHLVGHAVKQLYPDVKMVIGPVIAEGFYYDIYSERPFTPDDMAAIEKRMGELIAQDYDVIKKMTPRAEVIEIFKARGEDYKLRLIEDMSDDIQAMGMYYHQEYVDMPRPARAEYPLPEGLQADPHFRCLLARRCAERTAAAHLRHCLGRQEAARGVHQAHRGSRDARPPPHRQAAGPVPPAGRGAGPGVLAPEGLGTVAVVEQYMRKVYRSSGYGEVRCPQILDVSLWKKSGHWDNYQDNMFFTESEKRTYAVKPMNCPGHVQVFNQGLHSYRDLPIRYGEFGSCHRNEPSGAARHPARARFHPGRRPCVLHREPDRVGSDRVPPAGAGGLQALRL